MNWIAHFRYSHTPLHIAADEDHLHIIKGLIDEQWCA